jgi:hypothetical protein
MRTAVKDSYILVLWLLCGEALYSLFEAWWPWQRPFWDNAWVGGLLIAILAALIILPAANAVSGKAPSA